MEDKQIFFNMNIFSLKDKVIIVTGASGLLGFEYCKAIASGNNADITWDDSKKELIISSFNNESDCLIENHLIIL